MLASAFPIVPIVFAASVVAAQVPSVTSLDPAHEAVDVDATSIEELVVRFDRPMQTVGFSFCGGGPGFPEIPDGRRPFWRDARTCVLPVSLQADHTYTLALNCSGADRFRGVEGVPLDPTPWRFVTRPAEPRPATEQRARNAAALAALRTALLEHYSYVDRRGVAWPGRFDAGRDAILAAPSDRGFALLAAALLRPSQDLHAWVDHDGDRYPVGERTVDTLFRPGSAARHVGELRQAGREVLAARTDDGIGYLAIGTFTARLDIEAVERELAGLADAKGLVVDVRMNAGGDEERARRIAAWFVTGERVYAKHRTRVGPGDERADADGFLPVAVRRIRGNAEPARRFDGPVVLLQSRHVMSSAEAFVLMMRQAERCTTVGQATYGSSGNPRPHELPNGVTVMLPSWRALRPDGSCFEGEGIAPDVVVAASVADLATDDPMLAAALRQLRRD